MDPQDILEAARPRLDEAISADQKNRDRDEADRRFLTGDQYDEEIKAQREADKRPCPTFNGLTQSVRMVTAQIRSLNPGIKVSPSDNEATTEIAEIKEGLIRHIEQKCDAASVYEFAAENAAQGGVGYFRVRSDYEHEMSFDQEILIERVYNSLSVIVDPLARCPVRSDQKYCFLLDHMTREELEARYPGKVAADITSDHKAKNLNAWVSGDKVVVAEYYWIEEEEVTIGLLADGAVIENPPAPANVVKTRKSRRPVVYWAKVTHDDVLEGPTRVPGRYIPVFAVTGEEIHIGEEVYRSGVITHAKDAQVFYNLSRAAGLEIVGLQPKAPYMVTAKQIDGWANLWQSANKANLPYLIYNPDPNSPGPPQRSAPPVSSSGWMQEAQMASEDIKRTTGVYDAALGAKSNETSGKAINARKQESQASTSIYADNMVKAITHCGKVICEMIPEIYDTERTIQILGSDKEEQIVKINSVQMNELGQQYENDMVRGRYDVRVSVGPSYETQRAEAREGMMQFLQAVPQAGQVTADLVANAQEWPDADQFAERLKKILPPGLIPPETPQEQAQAGQAQQMQAMQMQMQMAAAEAELRKSTAEASEAEQDAEKAKYEVMDQQLEAMAKTGQINTVISQLVQQEVIRALMAMRMGNQPQPPQPQPTGPLS